MLSVVLGVCLILSFDPSMFSVVVLTQNCSDVDGEFVPTIQLHYAVNVCHVGVGKATYIV